VRRWLAVSGTVLLIAAWWTLPVAAASPSPAPGIQVWLDSDSITPDAPPGGILQMRGVNPSLSDELRVSPET